MNNEMPKIDFAPVMRECQQYAKLLKDVVDAGKVTEEQLNDITGYRLSIADSFCLLIFGDKFDEIRKGYFSLVADAARKAMSEE